MDKLTLTFSFYACGICGKPYGIEADVTEEPLCPYCGQPYFSHISDQVVILTPATLEG